MSLHTFLLPFLILVSSSAAAATPQASAPQAAPGGAARVDATFAAWDANKDHLLSLSEFEAGWAALQKATATEVALHRQFQAMDTDRSGAIEDGEYANLMLVKRAGKAAPALSAFDANKDQRLQFGEYLDLVRRLGATQATPAAVRK